MTIKNLSRQALTFLLCCGLANLCQAKASTPVIVLIIDDMGNNLELGQRAIELPGAINFAFLPHLANTAKLAEQAYASGKEVLLHAPMSNIHDINLGPGALRADMEKNQFLDSLQHSINSVPHVQGLNNHMGSLLTQQAIPMDWLMQALKARDLYFVDSRTTAETVAETTAQNHQLPNLRRDVFLDHQPTEIAIRYQFERLLNLADKNGQAVAIGHPHPQTLAFLESALPGLPLRGYQLKLASEVLTPAIDQPCPNLLSNPPLNCLLPAITL